MLAFIPMCVASSLGFAPARLPSNAILHVLGAGIRGLWFRFPTHPPYYLLLVGFQLMHLLVVVI